MEELDRANLVVRLVSEDIYSSDPGVAFQVPLSKGVLTNYVHLVGPHDSTEGVNCAMSWPVNG